MVRVRIPAMTLFVGLSQSRLLISLNITHLLEMDNTIFPISVFKMINYKNTCNSIFYNETVFCTM